MSCSVSSPCLSEKQWDWKWSQPTNMFVQYFGSRMPQEGHMGAAEQMASVVLQYFISVLRCLYFLNMTVSEEYWDLRSFTDGCVVVYIISSQHRLHSWINLAALCRRQTQTSTRALWPLKSSAPSIRWFPRAEICTWSWSHTATRKKSWIFTTSCAFWKMNRRYNETNNYSHLLTSVISSIAVEVFLKDTHCCYF